MLVIGSGPPSAHPTHEERPAASRRHANPAPPRPVESSLQAGRHPVFARAARAPAKTEKFLCVVLCVEFAKTAGALAAPARHPLLAEPILYGARLLAAPLSGIGVRITRARGAICPGRESCDCCAPQ